MIGKSMARGDDESTPSAGAEAEGRSVGTRGWFIISECHWLTIMGELRSLWFTIISSFCNPKREKITEIFCPILDFAANCNTFTLIEVGAASLRAGRTGWRWRRWSSQRWTRAASGMVERSAPGAQVRQRRYYGSLLILAQLKKQRFWSAYTSYGSGVS